MGVKMVIVANLDTTMSIGRICAQVAHAATLAIINIGEWVTTTFQIDTSTNPSLQYWMQKDITKVVLKVWGKDQLLSLQQQAKNLNLPTALMIEDDGQITALAIGPADSTIIDTVTGTLQLL